MISNKNRPFVGYTGGSVKTTGQWMIDDYSNRHHKWRDDWRKLRWASETQMNAPFKLTSNELINWRNVNTWLDVGCGTGNYFKYITENDIVVDKMIGIDPVPEFVIRARENNPESLILTENWLDHDASSLEKVDLITSNGVFQTIDLVTAESFLINMIHAIKPQGQLFISTLNYHYKRYNTRREGVLWTYKESEFRDILEKHGFDHIEIGGFNVSGKRIKLEDAYLLYIYGVHNGAGI